MGGRTLTSTTSLKNKRLASNGSDDEDEDVDGSDAAFLTAVANGDPSASIAHSRGLNSRLNSTAASSMASVASSQAQGGAGQYNSGAQAKQSGGEVTYRRMSEQAHELRVTLQSTQDKLSWLAGEYTKLQKEKDVSDASAAKELIERVRSKTVQNEQLEQRALELTGELQDKLEEVGRLREEKRSYHCGVLEKRSDQLKRFNSRFVELQDGNLRYSTMEVKNDVSLKGAIVTLRENDPRELCVESSNLCSEGDTFRFIFRAEDSHEAVEWVEIIESRIALYV